MPSSESNPEPTFRTRAVSKPEQPLETRLAQWLTRLSAGTALTVGFIYGYGMVEQAGALRASGVPIAEGLRLTPLNQVLVVGAAALIPIAAVVAVMAWIVLLTDYHDRARPPKTRKRKRKSRDKTDEVEKPKKITEPDGPRPTSLIAWLFVVGFPMLVMPVNLAIAFVPMNVLTELYTKGRLRPRFSLVPYWSLIGLTLLLVSLTTTYFFSSPLSRGVASTRDGEVSGSLVTYTDSNAVIGKRAPSSLVAIPTGELKRVTITDHREKSRQSLLQDLIDWI